MKKIFLAVLLCFLSVSCVAFHGTVIFISAISGNAVSSIVATGIVDKDNVINPEFIFPENAESDKYANIGANIKIYSDAAEWKPLQKYTYIIGDVSPGGPADLVGIKTGDIVYNVNGRFTEKMSPYEALGDLIGGGEETVSLYIIDHETGLLKKFEVLKTIN